MWRATADVLGRVEVQYAKFDLNLRGSNQYYDQESGLHYNTHRYFDPESSRYLTPDPVGQQGGLNLYAFVGGDLANKMDLLGLQASSNESLEGWSLERKIQYVFGRAADLYPGEVGDALREMVSAKSLAITTGVLAAWAASHAFGVGEVADVVMAGIGWLFLGAAVVDILHGLVDASTGIAKARCVADLDHSAKRLAEAARTTTLTLAASGAVAAVSRVAGIVRGILGRAPAVKEPPPRAAAPPPVTLAELVDETSNSALFISMSRIGRGTNPSTGALGERVAQQILEAETRATFRSMQNASGNGADLVRINPVTRTIEHVEVKATQGSGTPERPRDLVNRFDTWVREAKDGELNGQQVSTQTRELAQQIDDLVKAGYKVEHRVAQVWLPRTGTTGSAGFRLVDWP